MLPSTLRHVLLWQLVIIASGLPHPRSQSSGVDVSWLTEEIDHLAGLKSRLTGSPNHKKLIARIKQQLYGLGLETHSDTYDFAYNDAPTSAPQLIVDGEPVPVAMYIPYSGNTEPDGIEASLIRINNPSGKSPDWEQASGKVAVLNITCVPGDTSKRISVWPGSPEWGVRGCVPASVANSAVNMTGAAEAGVKAVIYAWEGISSAKAFGEYGPFKMLYQDVPGVFVAGASATRVLSGADERLDARVVLEGQLIADGDTEVFWTIIPGSEVHDEAVIISTHTDGTNVVQENGYFALLAQAQALAHSPPRRTTILLFLTGHLHTAAISKTGRVMHRWMTDHQDLWKKGISESPIVFGSTVEHLGAKNWFEDPELRFYYPTGNPEEEMLFAATSELADLLVDSWQGALPAQLRISNPISSLLEQPGEGLPFLWNEIPEVSLVTAPDWLLKEWPEDFDERQLIDIKATKRQIDSFLRVWHAVDKSNASALGIVKYDRGVKV